MYTDTTPLSKRIQSFLWRAAMMALAAGLSWIFSHITDLGFNPTVTAIAGLILGEISKALNNRAQQYS